MFLFEIGHVTCSALTENRKLGASSFVENLERSLPDCQCFWISFLLGFFFPMLTLLFVSDEVFICPNLLVCALVLFLSLYFQALFSKKDNCNFEFFAQSLMKH